jgi:hypothetical protein
MKKLISAILFVFLLAGNAFSQSKKSSANDGSYARVDKLMQLKNDSLTSISSIAGFINASFPSEYDKIRAIFYWITQNISYAPELMYSFTNSDDRSKLARDVFDNRSGVCIGYAVLFDTLCKLTNVNSFIVLGSTKQSFLPSVIGHAWNAVKIWDEWQFVDPTWGSGYLNGNRFIKKRNNHYFLPDHEKLIHTHLPVDPIWQLLKRPVTLYQFHGGLKSTVATDWNYADSIVQYFNSGELAKIKQVSRRLSEFGYNSEVTSSYYNYLRSKELDFYNSMSNHALKNYNAGVDEFNVYIDFKNHQFTPTKPDEELARIIPRISDHLNAAEAEYTLVISQITDVNFIDIVTGNLKQLRDLRTRVNEEQEFVNKYLSTKKNKRRDLFYTKVYSVYGIPINKKKP